MTDTDHNRDPQPLPRDDHLTRGNLLRLTAAAGAGLVLSGSGSDAALAALKASGTARQRPNKKPSKLTVRVWAGSFERALRDGAVRTFTDATGIRVVFDRTTEDVSFTQVQQAIKAGNRPPVDVEWSTTNYAYLSIVQRLLHPLDPDIVTNLALLNKKIAQPPDRSWGYVGVYGWSAPITYNTKVSPRGSFKSWDELFDPKYRKSIAISGLIICHINTIAKLAGVDLSAKKPNMNAVWQKYRELKPNVVGLTDDVGNVRSLTTGVAKVLIGIISDSLAARRAGAPVAWAVPKEGVTVDRDVFFVNNHLPEDVTYYGQVFINHVLEKRNQFILANALGTVPVNRRTRLPSYMKGDPAFPFTEAALHKFANLSPTVAMARHLNEWQGTFERVMKG